MNDKLTLPCESCITKAVCKHKENIECSLLIEIYNVVENNESLYPGPGSYRRVSIVLEKLICDIFDWDYDFVYVFKKPRSIKIVNMLKQRHKKYKEMWGEET